MRGAARIQLDLRSVAWGTVVVIAVAAVAALLYQLLDVLLLVFVGIIVAAALQPWHQALSRIGVPKAVAVLMIYLAFLGALGLIGLLVMPVLAEQVSTLIAQAPDQYEALRATLLHNPARLLRMAGERLPPLQTLVRGVSDLAPSFYQDVLDFTASLVSLAGYFVTVLAIALYWTLELPRVERFVVSLLPAARRSEAIDIWHEIETKLGAFVRGQALAMLVIAVASAIGYSLIGLPNVLVLALLAGLLEAVPVLGPVLSVIPALAMALPGGLEKVALVIGWVLLLQVVENNVLMPRIMSRAVGISGLVSLVAMVAFGTLYGIPGVLLAIPLTAAIQVVIDRISLEPTPAPSSVAATGQPLASLRARLSAVRAHARRRLREREARFEMTPGTAVGVADAVDNQVEEAADRVADVMQRVEEGEHELPPEDRSKVLEGLGRAVSQMEKAIERAAALVDDSSATTVPSPGEISHTTAPLERAAAQVEQLAAVIQPVPATSEAAPAAAAPAVGTEAGEGRPPRGRRRQARSRRKTDRAEAERDHVTGGKPEPSGSAS